MQKKDESEFTDEEWKNLPDSYWKEKLPDLDYQVLRHHGTERAFTGRYWDQKDNGTYACRGCGLALFDSNTKFDSGTGWPSFYDLIDQKNIELKEDKGAFMTRTEVLCRRCGGHLGHVFEDGPRPTGLRYCMNGASLDFKKKSY